MMKRAKGLGLLLSSFLIGLLHLSFGFAKNTGQLVRPLRTAGNAFTTPPADSSFFTPVIKSVYDSLHLNLQGLSREAYAFARQGLDKLAAQGKILNQSVISIIDFSLPSTEKRLFIIDLDQYKVLFQTLVAHGRNTGRERAVSFSNAPSSFKSSPGFYITRETYQGSNGYSLKLEGMERGINDNAYERGIVIHGAGYVSEELARAQGYIGRSQGCPAVPETLARPIINRIKNSSLVFIYHPGYVHRSALLN